MKRSLSFFMVLVFVLLLHCSRIEIKSPAADGDAIETPYTLVVEHTGCGTIQPGTFKAWLDKESDSPQDISSAFTLSGETWTAQDFSVPLGNHTLSVSAEVTTGSMCYVGSSSDERTFFVAPCSDFETAWGEDFDMAPDTVIIEYGDVIIKIAQGESGLINLPEDSPFLDGGKLPATINYGIENITSKNVKFHAVVRHGDDFLNEKELVFCGAGVVEENQAIVLSASAEPLTFSIEGGDILVSPSDDTRPIFFLGTLQLRVYPL